MPMEWMARDKSGHDERMGTGRGLVPEFVNVGAFFLQHRLQRAECVWIEVERNPREEVMDEVEVLEHVEPVRNRLQDLALHPEHIGIAITLVHLMRLMGKVGEEIDDERRGEEMRHDP